MEIVKVIEAKIGEDGRKYFPKIKLKDDEYGIENSCYRQGYQPTITDAIANYINEKWEKLTPEEKRQVKGILE